MLSSILVLLLHLCCIFSSGTLSLRQDRSGSHQAALCGLDRFHNTINFTMIERVTFNNVHQVQHGLWCMWAGRKLYFDTGIKLNILSILPAANATGYNPNTQLLHIFACGTNKKLYVDRSLWVEVHYIKHSSPLNKFWVTGL